MTFRTVEYRIWPASTPMPAAVQATGPNCGTLTFDTEQVAREAMLELLQSAPSSVGIFSTIEDLLVGGDPSLLWRERGPGVGSEMRRGFSALFGRFFARAYLTEFHQLTRFVPLDRSPAYVGPRVRVSVVGDNRNLPDWIAVGQGQFVLAEAKGAYIDRPTYRDRLPMPHRLETAHRQLTQVVVEIERPSGRWTPIRTKGWGVLSRWGREATGHPPHLCVLDPWTEGDRASPDDIELIYRAVAGEHTALLLKGLGYTALAARVAPVDGVSTPPSDEQRVAVTVGDDERVFQGSVVGPTGRLVGEPDALKAAIATLPAALAAQFFFVGIRESELQAALQGRFDERKSRESIGSQGIVERDGTMIVPLSEVSQADGMVI